MSQAGMPEYRVSVDQLRPGVFVRLEKTAWFNHPFLFSAFKVKDESQIAVLRELGIAEVICVPEKCDVLPLRPEEAGQTIVQEEISDSTKTRSAVDALWEEKKRRAERLRLKKQQIAETEEHYVNSIRAISGILDGIVRGNSQSVMEALRFIEGLTRYFLSDRESSLHLMNVRSPEESRYSHVLNVAILSMMVGKEARLNDKEMLLLGMGALFHDVGQTRIEKKLLRKRGNLTRPEKELMQKHPEFGVDVLKNIPEFPPAALPIVAQHHECLDGSGYPEGRSGDTIHKLARIVAIADTYDNHCNHPDPDESLTPYLALAFMFGQQKRRFDREYLTSFIRCLGVYPPGTVVQLSNGSIGMVMSVNPRNQLKPSVVLYDSEVPKKEALIVDLEDEPDLSVEKSIRIPHLPPEIIDYLSPRARITYYVEGV